MSARKHLREEVFSRDAGVCASCGLDCVALLRAYLGAAKLDMSEQDPMTVTRALHTRLRRLGFQPGQPMWEADHVMPLTLGGADEIHNCRTLCRPCHRKVTAELAAHLVHHRPEGERVRVSHWRCYTWCRGTGRAPGRQRTLTGHDEPVCPRCWNRIQLRAGKVAPHRKAA